MRVTVPACVSAGTGQAKALLKPWVPWPLEPQGLIFMVRGGPPGAMGDYSGLPSPRQPGPFQKGHFFPGLAAEGTVKNASAAVAVK